MRTTDTIPAELIREDQEQMELIRQREGGQDLQARHARDLVKIYMEMDRRMELMAEMLRAANERMAGMEQALRTLEKITPWQVTRIGKEIKARAADLCEEYRIGSQGPDGWIPEKEAMAAIRAEIRKELREMTGARTLRETARCDYQAAEDFVLGWEDYEKIRKIRASGKERG